MRGPDAVEGLGALRPFQHGLIEADAAGLAKVARTPRGLARMSSESTTGGALAQLLGHHVKDFRLLDKADGAQVHVRPLLGIAGEHPLRLADQEGVGQADESSCGR